MITRLGLCASLAAIAAPLVAFTPLAPGDARETARVTDPVGWYGIAAGPAGPMAPPPRLEMPGDRTRIAWRSAGVPATALLETLSAQLAQAGFSEVFACETDRCGGFDFRLAQPVLPMPGMFVNLGDFRYLAVERKTPPAQASVLVSQTPGGAYAQLSVTLPASASPVAAAPGGQATVAAPVAAALPPDTIRASPAPEGGLGARLAQAGRATLDGLDFATGSATLADSDTASLRALAGWLSGDLSRRIALVGHSDWTGAPDSNVALSRRRAQAVADAVVALGAARRQITVAGVGPYAPRTLNDTDEGRAANRRVEAVMLPPAR